MELAKASCFLNYVNIQSNNCRETTVAVRGAVYARPLLFCLCWDADQAETELLTKQCYLNSDVDDPHNSYNVMDLNRGRGKMRRKRMKEALPRVQTSTVAKHSMLHDAEVAIVNGSRQRCCQFLNADKSRAVGMSTPPFDCGPVEGPVTIFCVGIATEDGCFVSGIKSRFELGHLHGIDAMDKEIDMSPIAICAEIDSTKPGFDSKLSYDDLSDDNVEHYQNHRKGSIDCECEFQHLKKDYDDDDKSAPSAKENNIKRGQIGPGRWHCYTAIFDGAKSVIRVDGCTEKVNNISISEQKECIQPLLDGLTIGSDHCFEMPLCFGDGSDGEGEGSIAELAVFKGSMPLQDIDHYERFFMKKHGIAHGQHQIFPLIKNSHLPQNIGNQWQEDKWRRQAHALMTNPPLYEIGNVSIPLRVAASHRSVAWCRSNDVTGQQIKVSRIGNRHSNGSSDW